MTNIYLIPFINGWLTRREGQLENKQKHCNPKYYRIVIVTNAYKSLIKSSSDPSSLQL